MERVFNFGAEALTAEELLALLMGVGHKRAPVRGIARDLLMAAGGQVGRLAGMTPPQLRKVRGIGAARAAQVLAALELARRWYTEPSEDRPLIRSALDIVTMLPHLRDLTATEYHLLVLDTQYAVSSTIRLQTGLSCCAQVKRRAFDQRTVFRAAIPKAPEALVLVHNHPNGDPSPSDADRELTRHLAIGGRLLDIPICDHVIVGRDTHISFLEHEWL
jgi:DNA repair protein RadC